MNRGNFICALVLAALIASTACAATTAFTYQGKLTDSVGQLANGTYTMLFRLWDSATGGSQVETTITKTGVSVSGGLFTVELDFGAVPFHLGLDRWLEVEVGSQTLSPRTKITTVPMAVHAQNAQSVPWSGITGAPTSFAPSGAAGGDLTGAYPNPSIADGKVGNLALASDPQSLIKVTGGAMNSKPAGVSIGTGPVSGPLRVYSPVLAKDQSAEATHSETHEYTMTRWQSFTAGATGSLAAIKLMIGKVDGSAWSGTLRIYQGEGIAGTLLHSQTISGSGFRYSLYALDTPLPVTAESMYTIAVVPSIALRWGTSYVPGVGDSYPRGKFHETGFYDARFATYMSTGTQKLALAVGTDSGNVGIGTGVPAAALDVAGRAKMAEFQLGESTTAGHVLTADASGVGTWQAASSVMSSVSAGGDLTGTYPNPTIADGKVDSPALSSDAASLNKVSGGVMTSLNGQIGIGTTAPSSLFEIAGMRGVVDQALESGNGTAHISGRLGQSFTAGISGTLCAIEIWIAGGEPDMPVIPATLRVFDGDGTTGTVRSTQSIGLASGPACWRIFQLATPVAVTAGSMYTFEVNTALKRVHLRYSTTDGYTRGRHYEYGQPDDWIDDIYFRTHVATSAATALAVQPSTLNVGIGTATPGFPLSFADTIGDKISLWGSSGNHYGFGVSDFLLQIHSDVSSSDIAFGYGSSANFTETMRIKNNGRVGIGTSAPEDALSVNGALRLDVTDQNGNALGPGAIRFGSGATGEGIACNRSNGTAGENQWGLDFYTHSVRRMSITLDGNIGIGTTNPAYKLHVNGSVAGVGAYNQLSDARYKTNIEPIPSALDKVEKLRGVTFDWKADGHPEIDFGDGRQAGVLAQEVQQVLPEAVTESADGTYSVSYSSLVPLLIEAIKEQQKQIDDLKSELATVKAQNP